MGEVWRVSNLPNTLPTGQLSVFLFKQTSTLQVLNPKKYFLSCKSCSLLKKTCSEQGRKWKLVLNIKTASEILNSTRSFDLKTGYEPYRWFSTVKLIFLTCNAGCFSQQILSEPSQLVQLFRNNWTTLLEEQSKFPRYNIKSRGKRDTTWNSPRSITFSQLHFMLYRGNSINFGTVKLWWLTEKNNNYRAWIPIVNLLHVHFLLMFSYSILSSKFSAS